MRVPFLNLAATYFEIADDLNKELDSFLNSGQYIGGPALNIFEKNFSDFVQSSICIGLGNGLDAIEISLRALGIQTGDEVIVPSNTFIATWLAVSKCGAVPIPVEPDINTCTINAQGIEAAITTKTKAIIPVHLYGQPVDLDPIIKLAKAHNIYVVEDAAQAAGSVYKSKRIGSHGDVVAWSFYPGKNLGAFGDGGAITTNNEELANKIKIISNYGSKEKYVHDVIGTNSRLDPMQAIVLNIKLRHLDEWNDRRTKIASRYLIELKELDLVLPEGFNLKNCSWHLFPIRISNRDQFMKFLHHHEIQTLIHYPIPPHKQKAYAGEYSKISLKVAEDMSSQLVSLPIGPHLTEQEVSFVIEKIRSYFHKPRSLSEE